MAHTPLESADSKTSAPMLPASGTDGGKPQYALATTQPPVANDFPVTYRVQMPDLEARVRPVQKTTLSISTMDTFKYVPGN
jgi:hypothetical protein